MHRSAFTLIELLVVIAIIGVLSALVITQLGNSSIKARNATAQSDIAEMGKAVESFRVDDTSLNQVVSNVPGSTDTLSGTSNLSGTLPQLFTGVQSVNGSASTYAAAVLKTPSSAYTYRYVASGTPLASSGSSRVLVGAGTGQPLYALCTNLVNAATPYYCAVDGSGAGPSSSNQVAADVGPGSLSANAFNGLVAWYQMEGSGTQTTAIDSSGNGNTGTLSSAFTFDGTSNGWGTGKYGNALLFDGANDSVTIPYSSNFAFTSYTLSAWIKTSNAGNSRRRIITYQPNPYMLMALNDNVLEFGDSPSSTLSTAGATLNNGAWHLVTVTKQAGVGLAWYTDGVQVGYKATNDSTVQNYNVPIYIGSYNNNRELFNGSIDDVRIYNRALSASEVQQLYQGTL